MEYVEARRLGAPEELGAPRLVQPKWSLKNREAAAMISVFTMDISWVALLPVAGLSATVAAVALQTSVVLASVHGDHFDLMQNVTILLWILSNAPWMFSEFLWDEARPEGVLGYVPGLGSLDKAAFPDWLLFAGTVCWVAVAALSLFYVNHLVVPRLQQAPVALCFDTSTEGEIAFSLPLRVYREFFVLPWLISDACWILCNRNAALGSSAGWLGPVGVAFGFLAIVIASDATRRYAAMLKTRDAALCMAELLWVTGNVAWMFADLTDAENFATRGCFSALFFFGLYLSVWLALTDDDNIPVFNNWFIPFSAVPEQAWLLRDVAKGDQTLQLNAACEWT